MSVMWIQILLVVGVIIVGLFLARPAGGDSHLALRRLFMAGFVIVAILSILNLRLTRTSAEAGR